jgi:hypothetical protein
MSQNRLLFFRASRLFIGMLIGLCLFAAAVAAQPPEPGAGSIEGAVTTQNRTIQLGAVLVTLLDGVAEVARQLSEGDGTFVFPALKPGKYAVTAVLEGFDPLSVAVTVAAGQTAQVPLDLPLGTAERVEVVAPATAVSSAGTVSSSDVIDSRELEQISPGGGLQAALRLLVSVIEVPGGVAIKGGRPSQATVQLGPGTFVDPATGLTQVRLPDDAVDTVTVLPNPYAVEYGRFSSGLVLIQTRRAGDRWRTRLNNLDPTFRTKRNEPLNIIGIASFSPRVETGGPLIPDKLFIQQSAQYRYRSSDVASRPEDELKRSHALSSFTRLDANLSPRHALVATAGLFPSKSKYATLGTFTPIAASVNVKSGVQSFAATERSLWSDTVFTETTVEVNRYDTEVRPQGISAMQLLPETTLGNFYNRQDRRTATYQLVHSVSGSEQMGRGLHLYKAGVDILLSDFEGASASRPVLIRRSNGTLSRRLDFTAPATQSIRSTDLAVFAQDRYQPTGRWYVEFGVRLDRDGIVDRTNVTPRVGAAVLLNEAGTSTLRAGLGLFYERTPSAAGVFDRYESFTETRFAADGVTPLGPPVAVAHTIRPNLRTSRSRTWDFGLDHRFNANWSVHAGVIDRRGADELLVERFTRESRGLDELELHSDGRSRYREAEIGVRFTAGRTADLNVSYVRSHARADLNAFTTFFDSVLWPIVGRNEYAPARADAPHRLLARGRAMPTPNWLFVGVLDWRTGLPYSVIDEAFDFVGPRNAERFPTYVRLEVGVERRIRLFRLRPWVGVRVDNALNAWLPQDVQANISSPAFRTFYNSEYRQFRIQVRFER